MSILLYWHLVLQAWPRVCIGLLFRVKTTFLDIFKDDYEDLIDLTNLVKFWDPFNTFVSKNVTGTRYISLK